MITDFSSIPGKPEQIDDFIFEQEQRHNLKPGTEARIIWDSNNKTPTEYSIVYLHGFKATHPEGDPVHRKIAKKFNCNLFLSRLQEHGLSDDRPLLHLTADKLLESAYFAFEIGKRIGEKVILMGTSTGGSLALYLASRKKLKDRIAALVLYSPLIDFYSPQAKLLRFRGFRSLLGIIPGKKFLISEPQLETEEDRIWYDKYAFQGALALGEFVNTHMHNDTFQKVDCPVFTGYYYKNRKKQDKVVSVSAIKSMFKNLATDEQQKELVNFPNANTHVICSSLLSKSVKSVIDTTSKFLSSHC